MYLFLFVVGGLIGSAIASAKGRNTIGWFLICAIIPIFGIFIILLMPNLKDQAIYIREKNSKQCEKCAETVQLEALVCKHCGHAFRGNEKSIATINSENSLAYALGRKLAKWMAENRLFEK